MRQPAPPRDARAVASVDPSRRRFLAALGLLGGAAALVPLIGRARAQSGRSRVETSRPLLGTWVRVVAHHDTPERAGRAVERAFAAVREVDAQMSVHRADSDLSRVNRAAGRGAVRVPDALLEVVSRASAFARRTRGVYDPTVLPLMTAYGFYGAPRATVPGAAELDRALELTDWNGIVADQAAGTLGLTREGAGLDLGSIGKGWAVDRAVHALREEGVTNGMVDAGGNIYALGTPGEDAPGWNVGVLHPVTGRTERVFTLRDAAVATSGNSERFVTIAGVRIGHLLDARSGRPSDGHLAVSVVARDGTDADRLSTTAFLLGPSRFHGWPEALDVCFVG